MREAQQSHDALSRRVLEEMDKRVLKLCSDNPQPPRKKEDPQPTTAPAAANMTQEVSIVDVNVPAEGLSFEFLN